MSGRITTVSSGTEGLTSQGVMDLLELPVDQLPKEAQEALLDMSGANSFTSGGELDVSVEDLKITDAASTPKAGECCAGGEKRPPLCQKVIGQEGNIYTILYDGNPLSGGDQLSMFTGLINAAVESDTVDFTIMTCFNNYSRYSFDLIKVLSLLNALKYCKAKKIITRAGCLTSLGDCALWLSGNDRRIGPMSWLMIRPPKQITEGSMRDLELRSVDMKKQIDAFGEFIISKGLLTEDEVNRLYQDEAVISLSYDDLQARIDALKN